MKPLPAHFVGTEFQRQIDAASSPTGAPATSPTGTSPPERLPDPNQDRMWWADQDQDQEWIDEQSFK